MKVKKYFIPSNRRYVRQGDYDALSTCPRCNHCLSGRRVRLLTFDKRGNVFHDFGDIPDQQVGATLSFHLKCARQALDMARTYFGFAEKYPEKSLSDRKLRFATEETFWQSVDQSAGSNDCWPWRKSFNHYGYGQLRFQGKPWLAHRLAYLLATGSLPARVGGEPAVVMHTCDNPPCCNPANLLIGTHADNCNDKIQKGRYRQGNVRGEESPCAKLTPETVKAIRLSRAAGEKLADLAASFSISETTVADIFARRSWKHIP